MSAVVLIKLYWFQTGSKPNNPSCSKQTPASAISEACMHWLQVYIAQPFLWTALTAYRSELHSIFNCIHTKIARNSSNPLFSEAHTGLRMFHSSVSVTRESNGCPETQFVARTLCKRTLLENHSSSKYFFHYKTMYKINESVCITNIYPLCSKYAMFHI